jgi:diguanylate cyclase (GGDEF)-like protein
VNEGLDVFARAWAREIVGTSYVPMARSQAVGFLREQADVLHRSLAADTFDAGAGRAVGTALARTGFTAPEALGRTVVLLQRRLVADLGLTGPAAAEAGRRLVRLTGSLTEGFVRAVRDLTLDAQDDLHRATLRAKARVENALRESEARALHAALHDPLTGLPNRTLFTEWLAALLSGAALTGTGPAARPAARFAVCLVGVDRFKSVNGTFGPAVGDRVLVLVAEQLRALATEFGCLVARIGGDEFGFLVPDTTCTDDALKFADRALRRIAEPMHVDGREIPLSASAGVLERAADGGDPADVMRSATITLHWAKADGRGRSALFDAGRNADDVARYALSAALPAGLRNDEFVLAYQPLVDLRTGAMVGVEALARWRHPARGELGPHEFIGLAEDSGLIGTLGLQVLEKACRQALRWESAGSAPPFVSVNLAVQQIRDPALVGRIAAVLDRVGLPAGRLQLEITESAVMSIDDHTLGTLRALRGLGVRLVIDDFGTGYANLSYLCDLPVHGLKLAAPFLRDLDGRQASRRAALLEAMVSVGHRFGLAVTAEGVETRSQADLLRGLGCDLAQGWLFGRPIPPGEVRF